MLKAYGKTDKGMVRAANQDNYALHSLSDSALLAVVCDGMGGERGGNVASRNAVNIISQNISAHYREGCDENGVRNTLLSAVSVANALVHDMALHDEALMGMGTTVVACILRGNTAHIVHAGDSRAYLVAEDAISRVTRDHSVVQMLIENGELSEAQAATHPKKHYITRALGVESSLDAEYTELELSPGQMLLLCTDGLTNHLSEQQLLEALRGVLPEQAPQRLCDLANQAGGSDNITAVVLLP